MAGSHAVMLSNEITNPVTNTGDQWEINFARFLTYPSLSSTCSDLVPLAPTLRNRRPKGNWISSSSIALLRLINDHKNSDVILTVSLNGKCLVSHRFFYIVHSIGGFYFLGPDFSEFSFSGLWFINVYFASFLVNLESTIGHISLFGFCFTS